MREETWDNDHDRLEVVLTPPITDIELAREKFPADGRLAAKDIIGFTAERLKALSKYPELEGAINAALEENQFALIREGPVNESDDINAEESRYFLSYGPIYLIRGSVSLVSIQLGLEAPNWAAIKRHFGFSPPEDFIEFAESFPGLIFGPLAYPQFLRPYSSFNRVREHLPKTAEGSVAVSPAVLNQLQRCIFFQSDYWSTYRFIGKDGKVKEMDRQYESLSDTELPFGEWARKLTTSELHRVTEVIDKLDRTSRAIKAQQPDADVGFLFDSKSAWTISGFGVIFKGIVRTGSVSLGDIVRVEGKGGQFTGKVCGISCLLGEIDRTIADLEIEIALNEISDPKVEEILHLPEYELFGLSNSDGEDGAVFARHGLVFPVAITKDR